MKTRRQESESSACIPSLVGMSFAAERVVYCPSAANQLGTPHHLPTITVQVESGRNFQNIQQGAKKEGVHLSPGHWLKQASSSEEIRQARQFKAEDPWAHHATKRRWR